MLVPEGGGMFSEMIGSARASLQSEFRDTSMPGEGGGAVGLLRRAQFLVNRGDIRGALDQLAHLEGRPAQAVSGWVESARQRLIVMQALRLLKAHVGAQSLGIDAGST
uniref:Mitofilin n=2 Tax=Hemiselmis andersenii TaxID=464988 RepID=A0A7S1DR10_HEMAN|mmetsp:Transcript_24665/g.59791  ORF Transcript_24665/g.59791 Transcript_24665/m.59791 type:complete len:108 (+) Transcript_24665:123-446(+)